MILPKDSKEALDLPEGDSLSLEFTRRQIGKDMEEKPWPTCKESPKIWEGVTEHRYKRWRKFWGERLTIYQLKVKSRLLIDTEGGAENHGLALWRWCGAPYLPGSGLKGCLRHGDTEETGYGTERARGDFIVLPGLPLREAQTMTAGITPHTENKTNPLRFPAVKEGSKFLIGIVRLGESPIPNVKAILEMMGVGAKTTSGFGWVEIVEDHRCTPVPPSPILPKLLKGTKDEDFRAAGTSLKTASPEDGKEFLGFLLKHADWEKKIGGSNQKGKDRLELVRVKTKEWGMEGK